MNDDATLLRRYAEEQSQAAFAELVRRHLDLVYSAAQRRLGGDAHRAADVAQLVFTKLARDAARLSGHAVLTAWLYTATRNAAIDIVRTEQRRRTREQEAHLMQTLLADAGPDPQWEKLRPVLDAAMDELSEADRTAVLLRFFEKNAFAEIGAALGVGEDAARMRVDRALDKLRTCLERRGVTSASAALATVLSSQTVTAAPAGLAATIASTSLTGVATSAAVGASGWAGLLAMTNLKIALVTATALAGLTIAWVEVRASRALETEINQLSAEHAALVNLQRENQRLVASAARPRAPRATAAVVTAAPAAAAAAPARSLAATPGLTPAAQWRNVGIATPEATFETRLWAKANSNFAALATTYMLGDRTRPRVNAFFAGLSDTAKVRFGTPEALSAYLHTFAPWDPKSPPPEIVAFRLVDRTEIGPIGSKAEGKGWVYSVTQFASGREDRRATKFTPTETGWKSMTEDPDAQWQKIVAYFDPQTGEPKSAKK